MVWTQEIENRIGNYLHIVVALLTLWWTLGIGNVAYAAYKRYTADEVTIKVDAQDDV
jgi:hypothetical protein